MTSGLTHSGTHKQLKLQVTGEIWKGRMDGQTSGGNKEQTRVDASGRWGISVFVNNCLMQKFVAVVRDEGGLIPLVL